MKPNAVKVATARLGTSALAVLTLMSGPVFAGDRALFDVIGYSGDSRYFAFEEFGIQDGSGFAYSNVYIVDLQNDSWVVGTPIRVQSDDETASLGQVRADVRAEAADDLTTLGIDVPGEIVALVGDGAPGNDGQSLAFGAPGYARPGDVLGDYQLQLSSFMTTATAPCQEWFSIDPMGFELTLVDSDGKRQLHRDAALPRSRGCPFTYRLYGVVLPFNNGSIDNGVAIVSVYPGGFEGPDRRFIAVPLGK